RKVQARAQRPEQAEARRPRRLTNRNHFDSIENPESPVFLLLVILSPTTRSGFAVHSRTLIHIPEPREKDLRPCPSRKATPTRTPIESPSPRSWTSSAFCAAGSSRTTASWPGP